MWVSVFFPNVPLVSNISHRVASILLKNSIKSLIKSIGYRNVSINPYTIAKLKCFLLISEIFSNFMCPFPHEVLGEIFKIYSMDVSYDQPR